MSINLSRNLYFNDNGEFYFNYAMVAGTVANGARIDIIVAGVTYRAEWEIPDEREILTNIEVLSEVSIFKNLMQRKMNFIHLFKSLPSTDTAASLSNFMKSVISAMLEALKMADQLYWLDKGTHVRSQYTLDYCLIKACELAAEKLQLQNIIDDIKIPDKIIKEHVEEAFEADIRGRKKNLNIAKAAKAEKGKNKKAKK